MLYWFAFGVISTVLAAVILGTGAMLLSLSMMLGMPTTASGIGMGRLSLAFAKEMIRGAAPALALLSLAAGLIITDCQRWRCDTTGSRLPA